LTHSAHFWKRLAGLEFPVPQKRGCVSVRGEWEGQEGRGGSEIWQGQASAGQDNLELTMLGLWQGLSSVCPRKSRLPQSSGQIPSCPLAQTPRLQGHNRELPTLRPGGTKCSQLQVGHIPRTALARSRGSAYPNCHTPLLSNPRGTSG
jgi:hypothetical protein